MTTLGPSPTADTRQSAANESKRAEVEQRIRSACAEEQWPLAATATLDAYGDEIASFLGSRLRGAADAGEVFSIFAEDLWVGLPSFGWRCSMRTWAYTLARNAAARYQASPERRPERALPLGDSGEFRELLAQARSTTRAYQKTEVKDRFRQLREQLDAEDQMLLVLRVDRGLSWRDLALAMSGDLELATTRSNGNPAGCAKPSSG
jgi:RNA polymerase sigma-70 factor (ECF subfamily)